MPVTHRMTVQFDARLHFDLNLPEDDEALVRDQTLLAVVVEPVRRDNTCASYRLKLRIGDPDSSPADTDDAERDFLQGEFVHRSAAEGAAQCLLQYLRAKKNLNVAPEIITEPHAHLPPEKQHFTAVGWSMTKHDPHAGRFVSATRELDNANEI